MSKTAYWIIDCQHSHKLPGHAPTVEASEDTAIKEIVRRIAQAYSSSKCQVTVLRVFGGFAEEYHYTPAQLEPALRGEADAGERTR